MIDGGTLRLTNSEMTAWRTCRRHWYLSYYRRMERRDRRLAGNALTLGTRVHDCLATYYDPTDDRDPFVVLEESRARDILLAPDQEFDLAKECTLVNIMLEGYFEWLEETGADADYRVLAAETKIEVPLIEGANLLSKIDARREKISTGQRLALEHKSCGSLDQNMALYQQDTQLLTEHLVEYVDLKEKGLESERAAGVEYNMLRKVQRTSRAKPPFYGRETVTHNVHELRSHFTHCARFAREIIAAHEALDAGVSHHAVCPPSPKRELVWWSSFFKDGIYGLMDDGSDWEAALESLYQEHDPLERYWNTTSYEGD